jgi:membrane protease YdiL (CAAX protease family)
VWSVVRFGLFIIGIGLLLAALAVPWVDLSFWRVFRRCASIAAAVSLWFCVVRLERRSFRSYGLPAFRVGKHELAVGLLLGFTTLCVLAALGMGTGVFSFEVTTDRFRLWRTLLGFVPAALLVSVLEELVFRGFILQHLLALSRSLAVGLSSALYAMVHLKHSAVDLLAGLELIGLFLLGVVLALSYLRTGHLYLAVGLHAVLAYGARINKLLIEFTDPSLSWLFGTSRLVNGLVSWLALLAVGAVIVRWVQPSRGGGVSHEQA